MQVRPRIVVVGGGYAGAFAAARASRRLGSRGDVHLISTDEVLVHRVRLHEAVARGTEVAYPLRRLLGGSGVRIHRGTVTDIAPHASTVSIDGVPSRYDRLILAVGSATAPSSFVGERQRVHMVDAGSIAALRRALLDVSLAGTGCRVVVCGGGLTGIEMSAELAESFPSVQVALVESGEVGAVLSARGRAYVAAALARLGVQVHDHTMITTVSEGHLETAKGPLAFDVCIWTGGFAAPKLAAACGLATDGAGRALADEKLRALGHPAIYVSGDAAAVTSRGRTLPMGCKTACPMAAHAANNAVASVLGRAERPFAWRDGGVCVSLGRRDGLVQALAANGEPRDLVITGKTAAWIKERICRYVVWRIRAERGWPMGRRSLQNARERRLLTRSDA